MSWGSPTPVEVWEDRYAWIRAEDEGAQHPLASYLLSSKGTFLSYDLDIAFCAGAWVAVIILSHAIIDATIRNTDLGDYKSSSKTVFDNDPDLEWLRQTRNALVHVGEGDEPTLLDTVDTYHSTLENDARRAMKLVFRTFYSNTGT